MLNPCKFSKVRLGMWGRGGGGYIGMCFLWNRHIWTWHRLSFKGFMTNPHYWPHLILFKPGLFLMSSTWSACPENKRQGGEGLLKNHESANKLQMPIRSIASKEFKLASGSLQGWPHIEVGQRSLLVFHCDNQAPSSKAKPLRRDERIWMSSRITAQVHA